MSPTSAAAHQRSGPPDSPLPIPFGSMSVQNHQRTTPDRESERERCVNEIWDLISNSTDSESGDSSSRRIAPDQLNRFLSSMSSILIKQNPDRKETIEQHFFASSESIHSSVDLGQFKIILSDLETWYMQLLSDERTPGHHPDQDRQLFWQTICDELNLQQEDSGAVRSALDDIGNPREQPHFIVVKKSTLTRSRTKACKLAQKPTTSTRTKIRPPALRSLSTDRTFNQNVQLEFQIPIVSEQQEREHAVEQRKDKEEQSPSEVEVDRGDDLIQEARDEPPLAEPSPPCLNETITLPKKKRPSMKNTVKAKVKCWNKTTQRCAKENIESGIEPGVSDKTELADRPIKSSISSKKHRQKKVAAIKPTTDVLRDCILFDNNDRIQTLHKDEVAMLQKKSCRSDQSSQGTNIDRKPSVTASAISLNALDATLISRASSTAVSDEIPLIFKTRPYIPGSYNKQRSLSSLSSSSLRMRAEFEAGVDFLDLARSNPFDESPEGWLIASAPEQDQGNHTSFQKQKHDQLHQQRQNRHRIYQQRILQRRKMYLAKQQRWQPRLQNQEQQLEAMDRLTQIESDDDQAEGKRIGRMTSEKAVWKSYRGAQPRRHIRRRVRLSGWELSSLLKKLARPELLQVDGEAVTS